MRSIIYYIIGIVLGLLALGYTVTHGLYITSVVVGLLLAGLLTYVYRKQQSLRRQREMLMEENIKLHSRLAEGERQLQYMRRLAENVETALLIATPMGRIEWCNKVARHLLSDHPDTLPQGIAEAIAQGQDEVEGMALSATQLKIEGRRRTLIALKNIQPQMERHEIETWRQLTRTLSHEILNSITPIITIAGSMQAGQEESDLGTGLSVIERRCRSLVTFVDNYRKLARIDEPQKTSIDAAELMADMKQLFPCCQYSLQPQDLTLTADRTQLEQVLINLLRNAEEAGATHIMLRAEPGRLTITDDGQGMTPDVMKQIFTPFYSTKRGGSGIGLSLCRQIITQHGGSIRVESQPGEGTTFEILL